MFLVGRYSHHPDAIHTAEEALVLTGTSRRSRAPWSWGVSSWPMWCRSTGAVVSVGLPWRRPLPDGVRIMPASDLFCRTRYRESQESAAQCHQERSASGPGTAESRRHAGRPTSRRITRSRSSVGALTVTSSGALDPSTAHCRSRLCTAAQLIEVGKIRPFWLTGARPVYILNQEVKYGNYRGG